MIFRQGYPETGTPVISNVDQRLYEAGNAGIFVEPEVLFRAGENNSHSAGICREQPE